MEIDDKQKELLGRLGSSFFTVKECAVILEVDEIEFTKEMKDSSSPCYKAYYSGFYTSKLKHREGVIEVSERGSNPAQQMVEGYIKDASKP